MFVDLEKVSYLIQIAHGKLYIKIEDDYQHFLESEEDLVQRYKYP